MNMNYAETMEYLNELREMSGIALIVEGKNDKRELAYLGVKNVFICRGIQHVQILAEQLKQMGFTTVGMLTDYDGTGKELSKAYSDYMQSIGLKIDKTVRERFRKAFDVNEIQDIIWYSRNCPGFS